MEARTSGYAPAPPRPAARPHRPRARPDAPYRVEVMDLAAAQGHLPAWRDLAERALEPNAFAEPDLVLAAMRHLPDGRRVDLLAVWQGDGLQGMFPVVPPRLPLAPGEVKLWRPPLFSSGVPLLDRDRPEAALEQALAYLASSGPRFAGFSFPEVPEEGAFAGVLRAVAARTRRGLTVLQSQERAVLSAGASPEQDVRHKTLKELRRLARRMGEVGEVRLDRARTPAEVRDAVEEFLVLEASGWKARRGTALIQNAGVASFVRTATRELARLRRCRVDLLRVGGRPVAGAIVLRSGSRAWFWKTAHDEELGRFSPGVQLALHLTRAQLENPRLDYTDSCAVPDHPMIDHLWRGRLRVADYLVAVRPDRSPAATAVRVGEACRRRVRGAAKHLYHRLAGAAR